MQLMDTLFYGKATLFKFWGDYSHFFGFPNFYDFYGTIPENADQFHARGTDNTTTVKHNYVSQYRR